MVASVHLRGVQGYQVEVRARTHAVRADEPPERGGTDTGPAPFEHVLAGLAACTAITLRMYADRKGWALGEVRVDARLFEAGEARRVERTLRFGAPLDEAQRAKLLEIADRTPVTRALRDGLPIATAVGR